MPSDTARTPKAAASRRKIVFWIGLLAFLIGAVEAGQPLETFLQSTRNLLRSRPASGDIVLVAIDDKSLKEINTWPWPRKYHAILAEKLAAKGAKEIFFDINLTSASDRANDRAFEAALARLGGRVTLASRFVMDPISGTRTDYLPIPEFRKHARLANTNVRYNHQGAVLDLPYALNHGSKPQSSMAAAIAGREGRAGETFPIDYSIDPSSIPVVSAIDVIRGSAKAELLAGRQVLVGLAALQIGDIYFAPGRGQLPGAYLHALGAETLKSGTPVDAGWLIPFACASALTLLSTLVRGDRVMIGILFGGAVLFLIAPFVTDAILVSTAIVASLVLLLGVGGSLAWSNFRSFHRRRGTTNPISGMPNFNALRQDPKGAPHALIVAKIRNYAEVTASLPASHEKTLVDQIGNRLKAGGAERQLFQGDGGVFVWFSETPSTAELEDHLAALHVLFRSPVTVAGDQIDLTVCFGVDDIPDRSISNRLSSALVAADDAAHEGVKWKWYDPSSLEGTSWKFSLLSQLDAAIISGDVWVAYQPKLDLRTGAPVGAEALIRWTHPEKGPINPLDFILVAEQQDRVENLTAFVLDEAVRTAALINSRKVPFGIAVNISARLISNPVLTTMVEQALSKHGLPPERLTLEITETAALATTPGDLEPLNRLRRMGVRISIDDYGTGLSTLEYLKKVPADEIKIDRSFIQSLRENKSDRLMVHSTVELAHSLGRVVVAEGVEDAHTLNTLKAIGCDLAQGYFIGKPMTYQCLKEYHKTTLQVASA